MTLDKLLNLSVPQFIFLYNGDNSNIYLVRFSGGLNEIVYVEYLINSKCHLCFAVIITISPACWPDDANKGRCFFFLFLKKNLFYYLFIFGSVGFSLLRVGFL